MLIMSVYNYLYSFLIYFLNYKENIFDGPKNEFRYKWDEFQRLLVNIFGEQTEPPDVPRKYIADALMEVKVFETESDSPPESIQVWKNRLQSWWDKILEIRTLRKLRRGMLVINIRSIYYS